MRRDDGFTLVEVLAALMVFSIAAIGLMQLTAQSVRTAAALEQRFAARVVASNVMAESLVQTAPLTFGDTLGSEEQMGESLAWRRFVAPAEEDLLQITVIVFDDETGQELAELTALRGEQG